MKHIFWILRKVDILVILKAPLGFKLVNCRPVADISSYCATLLTYTSIKKEKIYVYDYTVHFIVCFEKNYISVLRCPVPLQVFYIFCSFKLKLIDVYPIFFLSKKDQLYDLIQLDIRWKLKFKICIKMLV